MVESNGPIGLLLSMYSTSFSPFSWRTCLYDKLMSSNISYRSSDSRLFSLRFIKLATWFLPSLELLGVCQASSIRPYGGAWTCTWWNEIFLSRVQNMPTLDGVMSYHWLLLRRAYRWLHPSFGGLECGRYSYAQRCWSAYHRHGVVTSTFTNMSRSRAARFPFFRFLKESQRRIHSGKTPDSTNEPIKPFYLSRW